jgi:hypothetical protein
MPQVYHRRRSKIYSPADRTVSETVELFPVHKGDRVCFGDFTKSVLSSTANTIAVQLHSGAAGGIMAATDTSTGAAGDIVNMGGTALADGGLLVTADGYLEVAYVAVAGGGTTTPQVRFNIFIVEEEQKS